MCFSFATSPWGKKSERGKKQALSNISSKLVAEERSIQKLVKKVSKYRTVRGKSDSPERHYIMKVIYAKML